MAKLSKTEFLNKLKGYLGEDDMSDEALSLYEDASDSFEEDTENWKEKYEQNDKEWRQKYRDRFFNNETKVEDELKDELTDDKPVKTSFAELFKTE